ncbi:ha-tagged protein kinase domain of mitogen-activated protein kinase kinase kinase, partial [Chrysochromulina tobinii]
DGSDGQHCQTSFKNLRARPKPPQQCVLDSKYQLGEELGRGSSGKVYRALNRETGDFRAIKQIPACNMPIGHLEAVQSEIDLLHNLQHPQIVRYFETIRTEEHLYLVLEYVENGSLATLVKHFGALPEHLVCVYVHQVLIGLEWLHEQGVCHRDIKGANLLITKDGQVKLADFGVAKKEDSRPTAKNSVVGTPYWMAPEIIQMSAFTTASDIWSLGCTILELLTGEPPYFELKPITALYRIVQDEHPPLPSDLSPALLSFVTMCFTRDPAARPTASQLRRHAWLEGARDAAAARASALLALDSVRAPPKRIGQLEVQTVTTIRSGSSHRGLLSPSDGYDSDPQGYYAHASAPGTAPEHRRCSESSRGAVVGESSRGAVVGGSSRGAVVGESSRGAVVGESSRGAVVGESSRGAVVGESSRGGSRQEQGGSSQYGSGGSRQHSDKDAMGHRSRHNSGFLWKRSRSWMPFIYRCRFFYLVDDALCYRTKRPSLDTDEIPPVIDKDEKRIPLATVTCVRMYSKLKYEFEVVCKHRSYRLRAPSAQALALWVAAISSEWMALQHSSPQQQQSMQQSMHHQHAARNGQGPAVANPYGPIGHAPAANLSVM